MMLESAPNNSLVRPPFFIISGLVGIPNIHHYYIFLFFVYIVSIAGNSFVMFLIFQFHNLRTPKYVVVFNLAFVDLFGSSALVPKLIDTFLFDHLQISYDECMAYLFFCYSSLSMQSFNLGALAYDRLVAVAHPLHYHVKITHRFMMGLMAFFWLVVIVTVILAVFFLTTLSYCKSVVIKSYFCDHGQMYRLACNNNFANYVLSVLNPILILWLPLAFILFSYLYIGVTLSKVATLQEGLKALKTCTAHLMLVGIFYLPILATFAMMSKIHTNARIINLSITSVLPAMLNPIVYVLQTQEIRESVRKLFHAKRKSRVGLRSVNNEICATK
uniref:G-protein coupled receptors family 1 profile domain-containing protein n=1 Tax=Neogobius melanostomus TaxID=47308 RepID=A0A8C6TCH4_9GOBI